MARILVVDDKPENLSMIELYLRGTEFEVVTATGGHAAIELSMHESFDLILLDVMMPGIDGFEVCRRLKNDPRTAFVPVIFVTGRMGDESDKLAAYQLGAVDYITKPVDRKELVARIRVMLRLEDARSRLDRENVGLRGRLMRAEQQLAELGTVFEGVKKLAEEKGAQQATSLMTLSSDLVIDSFDPDVCRALGEIKAGAPLTNSGEVAAHVAQLIRSGATSSPLVVTSDDGEERELSFRCARCATPTCWS